MKEIIEVGEFAEKSYLDYSMYVIQDRALPSVTDGLKPSQRRLLYAMYCLKLEPRAKPVKSARVVGDVVGKFHPHGDSAVYEAMVLMSQSFSNSMSYVEGQGNFGSIDDPKSFAAARYTEAKLTNYSYYLLLKDLKAGGIEFTENYDATREEPTFLPSVVPNLLVNGSTGIAVGLATNIPPHNLNEVCNATIAYIDGDNTKLNNLIPDFPNGCSILLSMDKKGLWTTVLSISLEDNAVIINAVPYGTNPKEFIKKLADLLNTRKLAAATDLVDESDLDDPFRIAVYSDNPIKTKAALLAQNFSTSNFNVNANVLGINGLPSQYDNIRIVKEWLEFRVITLRKGFKKRVVEIENRLHIIEGLLIVTQNIKQIIDWLNEEDDPERLMEEILDLTDLQINAALSLTLRSLKRLEVDKLEKEKSSLVEEKVKLIDLINIDNKIYTLIKEQLQEAAKLSTPRRSEILYSTEQTILEEEESFKVWVSDIVDGNIQVKVKKFSNAMEVSNNSNVMFLDTNGKLYTVRADSLIKERGSINVYKVIKVSNGGKIFFSSPIEDNDLWLFYGGGQALVSIGSNLETKVSGRSLLKGSNPLTPIKVDLSRGTFIAFLTSNRRLGIVPIESLITGGSIKVGNKDYDIISMVVINPIKDRLEVIGRGESRDYIETDVLIHHLCQPTEEFKFLKLNSSLGTLTSLKVYN